MKRLLPCVLLLVLGQGCEEPTANGWVKGSLFVASCVDGEPLDEQCPPKENDVFSAPECSDEGMVGSECAAFDLEADFFSLEVFGDDSAKMRIQRGGQDLALSNGLVFEVYDIRRLRGKRNQTVPVGPDANIRAAMALFASCPDGNENFELQGTVTFSQFGNQPGDRIAGCINMLEIRNGRGEQPGEVLGYLQGSFDFVYQRGTPYQRFSR